MKLHPDWKIHPYEGSYKEYIQKTQNELRNFLDSAKIISENDVNEHTDESDTYVYPLLQMGQLGIKDDSDATDNFLSKAELNSRTYLSTGYFNLTEQYSDTIAKKSTSMFDILMAHPNVSHFC